MSAVSKFNISVDINEVAAPTSIGGKSSSLVHSFQKVLDIASGTADGQADVVYSNVVNLTTTPTDLDLRGSLASKLDGSTVNFVDVVCIIVNNKATSGNIVMGGAASNQFSGFFGGATQTNIIPPGGFSILYFGDAGLGTTAGTGDLLRFVASAGTVAAEIVILGRSA